MLDFTDFSKLFYIIIIFLNVDLQLLDSADCVEKC